MSADVYWSNGKDALLQRFSAHSTICRTTSGQNCYTLVFSETGGMECGHGGEDEAERQEWAVYHLWQRLMDV